MGNKFIIKRKWPPYSLNYFKNKLFKEEWPLNLKDFVTVQKYFNRLLYYVSIHSFNLTFSLIEWSFSHVFFIEDYNE